MKKQIAAGFIPYEIGDTVTVKGKPHYFDIENIRFVQYIKDGNSQFEVMLSCYGVTIDTWINANEIESRVIEKKAKIKF